MNKASDKRKLQLGMPFGTAQNKLRKTILFCCVQKLGEDVCYRCGQQIESVDDFSIEHKEAWLDSEDPTGLFFNLNNISFSHLVCNSRFARQPDNTGERSGRRKLNAKEAKEIRDSKEKSSILAARYGISTRTVRQIRSRDSWKNLGR